MSRRNFSLGTFAAIIFWMGGSVPLAGQLPVPEKPHQGREIEAHGNPGFGNQGFLGSGMDLGQGAPGGAANADFDSLIDLIQSTVAYDTWMENGTGEGEIQPFPTGVYADPEGTLRFSEKAQKWVRFRSEPGPGSSEETINARTSSALRYVSLPRLEHAIARRQLQREPLTAEMLTFAGLERIEWVLINPESCDLIVAGPAGDWRIDQAGVIVGVASGRPVLRLDDFLSLIRRHGKAAFGCSITPRQAALADTQEYLSHTAATPIGRNDRKKWLTGLRDSLGKQDVEFFGVVPDSHLGMVLLIADYHMKLVGMGLAEGVDGVESYLNSVELGPNGAAPPMAVLRWWFAMSERSIEANAEMTAFKIPQGGVQVLSENELLAARGQRVHTNESDALNRRFADSFTAAFPEISKKYPIYGELQNVFDLAMFLSLVDQQRLLDRSGWQPTIFEDPAVLKLPQLKVPREVETVVNHRVINRRHIIAGISGGVWIDSDGALRVSKQSELRPASPRPPADRDRWWWDDKPLVTSVLNTASD